MSTVMPARFITVEGIEGVGKSTNLAFIRQFLRRHGKEVVLTREPGGTPLGESVRHLLLDPENHSMTPLTELLLVFAARAQHLDSVIKPALARGAWVVCDRFIDATYAYQGGGRQLAAERIAQLEEWVLQGIQPGLTLLLDAPVDIALQRANGRSAPDRFEQERADFFDRVRGRYLDRAHSYPRRIRIIDTSKPLATVQAQVGDLLSEFLGADV